MADRIITPDTFERNRGQLRRSAIATGTGGNIGNDHINTGTIGGPDSTRPRQGPAPAAPAAPSGPLRGSEDGSVTYQLGGSRPLPLQDSLMQILQTAARAAGVKVIVYSAGQITEEEAVRLGASQIRGTSTWALPGGRRVRTGTIRHDLGYAADIQLWLGNRQISHISRNTQGYFTTFVQAARQAGATGFGAGSDYMQSGKNIHVDNAAIRPVNPSPAGLWGNNNTRAGAAQWLINALPGL
jgi:hypothetical protein